MKKHNAWNGMTEGDMLTDIELWAMDYGMRPGDFDDLSPEGIRILWSKLNEGEPSNAPFIFGIYEYDSYGTPMTGVYTGKGLATVSFHLIETCGAIVYKMAQGDNYRTSSPKPPASTWKLLGRVTPDGYVPEGEDVLECVEDELVQAADTIEVREYTDNTMFFPLEMVETSNGWAPLVEGTARRLTQEVYDLAQKGEYMTSETPPGRLLYRITSSGEVIDEV